MIETETGTVTGTGTDATTMTGGTGGIMTARGRVRHGATRGASITSLSGITIGIREGTEKGAAAEGAGNAGDALERRRLFHKFESVQENGAGRSIFFVMHARIHTYMHSLARA